MIKMNNPESQSLDKSTKTMNAARLQVSQSDSEETGVPDAKSDAGTNNESLFLTNLAGELQNLIVANLHPSAAIALSQTNHYFNSFVSLHTLPSSVVHDFLQKKERLYKHIDHFACFTLAVNLNFSICRPAAS